MPPPKGAAAAVCGVGITDLASEEISAIPDLSRSDLTELWIEAYGQAPSTGLSRRLLEHAAAYRLQARTAGGLKPAASRGRAIQPGSPMEIGFENGGEAVAALGHSLRRSSGGEGPAPTSPHRPNTRNARLDARLFREWHGADLYGRCHGDCRHRRSAYDGNCYGSGGAPACGPCDRPDPPVSQARDSSISTPPPGRADLYRSASTATMGSPQEFNRFPRGHSVRHVRRSLNRQKSSAMEARGQHAAYERGLSGVPMRSSEHCKSKTGRYRKKESRSGVVATLQGRPPDLADRFHKIGRDLLGLQQFHLHICLSTLTPLQFNTTSSASMGRLTLNMLLSLLSSSGRSRSRANPPTRLPRRARKRECGR